MSILTEVTVYMGITGLCGFVPATGGMDVVCLNAEAAGNVHTHRCDHFVGLLVGAEYYEDDCGFPDEDITTDEDKKYRFFRVRHKRLSFLGESADDGLSVRRCNDLSTCPRDCDEEICFDWVPHMRSVINRQLRSNLWSLPDRVSSIFDLRAGLLTSGWLTRTEAGKPVIWEIDRGAAKDYQRATAESALLRWEAGRVGEVTICLRPLAGDGPAACGDGCQQKIVLKPDEEGKIGLEFKNQPWDKRFPDGATYYKLGDDHPEFPHLYRLLAGDLYRAVPEVVGICPIDDCTEQADNDPPLERYVLEDIRRYLQKTANNPHCPGADFGGP